MFIKTDAEKVDSATFTGLNIGLIKINLLVLFVLFVEMTEITL